MKGPAASSPEDLQGHPTLSRATYRLHKYKTQSGTSQVVRRTANQLLGWVPDLERSVIKCDFFKVLFGFIPKSSFTQSRGFRVGLDDCPVVNQERM